MARREASRGPAGQSLSDRIRFHAVRWVPLLVTALLTYALFPPPSGVLSRVPDVGRRADRDSGRDFFSQRRNQDSAMT